MDSSKGIIYLLKNLPRWVIARLAMFAVLVAIVINITLVTGKDCKFDILELTPICFLQWGIAAIAFLLVLDTTVRIILYYKLQVILKNLEFRRTKRMWSWVALHADIRGVEWGGISQRRAGLGLGQNVGDFGAEKAGIDECLLFCSDGLNVTGQLKLAIRARQILEHFEPATVCG